MDYKPRRSNATCIENKPRKGSVTTVEKMKTSPISFDRLDYKIKFGRINTNF